MSVDDLGWAVLVVGGFGFLCGVWAKVLFSRLLVLFGLVWFVLFAFLVFGSCGGLVALCALL